MRGLPIKGLIRRHVPRPLWIAMGAGRRWTEDAIAIFRRRDPMLPPRRLMFVGDGNFRRTGQEFLGYFRTLGGLRPHDRVLDMGSGIGRMAVPLTRFLSSEGSYEGIDIVPHGVEWCAREITTRFPNFRFQLADVHNAEYNPAGRQIAAEYRFPFPNGDFDFVFLTSVFTHLKAREVENYLAEVSRVLKEGGTVFSTWFLLNGESRQLLGAGKATLAFAHPIEHGLTVDTRVPEAAIAFDEDYVRGLHASTGLALLEPVHFGSWCGRTTHLSYQDICVARKPTVRSLPETSVYRDRPATRGARADVDWTVRFA